MRRAACRASAALLAVVALCTACGASETNSDPGTIELGDGVGDLGSLSETLGTDAPVDEGDPLVPVSPLGVSSSCTAQITGDLRQQLVSPSSIASVRTDHWLSFDQLLAITPRDDAPGVAPLDGWLSLSCTLPNGDTVTARTADSTTVEQMPVIPANHVVAPGLPSTRPVTPDPSGAATWVVLVTLDGALYAPVGTGEAIVTSFDQHEVVVTVRSLLQEVEPLGEPRSIALDASFRATCGAPYEGCVP